MEIGIIAEGRADQFVLRNILYAFDIEKADIQLIRPELETDVMDSDGEKDENTKSFGSWTNVQKDCLSREPFVDFFENFEEDRYMIVQLDSDVCSEYGVQELVNIKEIGIQTFFVEMRNKIIDKVKEWLAGEYVEKVLFAICIRQIDAWVLTIYANQQTKDTGGISMPKRELQGLDAFKKLKGRDISMKYAILSEQFSNPKKLSKFQKNNQSLSDFVTSIQQKLKRES